MALEANFDGLVGPTHNYSGLSFGNLASTSNKASVSQPRKAALQGLAKMWALHRLGLTQALLPPHERPFWPALKNNPSQGHDLRMMSSAAAMWTANAATVIPASDSIDGRLHIVVANLRHMPHRAIEAQVTERILNRIFADSALFAVHPALPAHGLFGDEGAANHTRFCKNYGDAGVHLFVYGQSQTPNEERPHKHPARQTKEASEQVAHYLGRQSRALFAQQSPKAIDAGAFHNDVVSVGNKQVFLYHEEAFTDPHLIDRLQELCTLTPICVRAKDLNLHDAVKSYLFNSQLVSLADGHMALIAPSTCEEMPNVRAVIDGIVSDATNPISRVMYFNLHESMKNGGGPACLRLRVVLDDASLARINQKVLVNEERYNALVLWVQKHYRETLTPEELSDPALYTESCEALDALTQMLDLGALYDFQRG